MSFIVIPCNSKWEMVSIMPINIVLGHLPFVRTSQPDHYRTGYFDNEIGIFPRVFAEEPGADAGFFLGGGALVSCSTSTLINHIVFFFAEYQLY